MSQTGRPARIDDYSDASGLIAESPSRELGSALAVGVPVSVEGTAVGRHGRGFTVGTLPLPADTEAQLAGFTELAATAIANARAARGTARVR